MKTARRQDRLTRLVLKELPPRERAALTAEIAADPALRTEAEALQDFCGMLHQALQTEPLPKADSGRRAELRALLQMARPAHRRRWPGQWNLILAAAATVTLVLGTLTVPRFQNFQQRTTAPVSESISFDLAPNQDDARSRGETNTESYRHFEDNPFHRVSDSPLSTFAADVDTASYAIVRRFLRSGKLPPAGAVRIEELVNYFPDEDPAPAFRDGPLAVRVETAAAPWQQDRRLVRIALKGQERPWTERVPFNLVFLIDVSGSMRDPQKLPLVKAALKLLVDRMSARDRISLVVYAGDSGLALPPTPGDRKAEILAALDELHSGGSTNGAEGISLAYRTAESAMIAGGVNRVILATDGDFNVGVASEDELVRLVEAKARSGVFLSVLGFGSGNYKDSTMEMLADRGNGNYAYIDSLLEARKALVEQAGGTLVTIAKDVKIQVEFNPAKVSGYRLIGYENRLLASQDFNDDNKDAGDIGAGHTVTALYEIVPAGAALPGKAVDPLKYQQPRTAAPRAAQGELLTVKVRYKRPDADRSDLIELPVMDQGRSFAAAGTDFRFSAAVAAFGLILRDSPHKGTATMPDVARIAAASLGDDRWGYRRDFVELARTASDLLDDAGRR